MNRKASSFGALILAALALQGCVDKEKCEEAIRVTRDALTKEQPDIARQWRDRAWKICNDAATSSVLDKEILDKEADLKKRADDLVKAVITSAQKRMNTAQAVWLAFDALEEKDRTPERLAAHKSKAWKMSAGLPPEYAKQLDEYNGREYAKRKTAVEALAKKKG